MTIAGYTQYDLADAYCGLGLVFGASSTLGSWFKFKDYSLLNQHLSDSYVGSVSKPFCTVKIVVYDGGAGSALLSYLRVLYMAVSEAFPGWVSGMESSLTYFRCDRVQNLPADKMNPACKSVRVTVRLSTGGYFDKATKTFGPMDQALWGSAGTVRYKWHVDRDFIVLAEKQDQVFFNGGLRTKGWDLTGIDHGTVFKFKSPSDTVPDLGLKVTVHLPTHPCYQCGKAKQVGTPGTTCFRCQTGDASIFEYKVHLSDGGAHRACYQCGREASVEAAGGTCGICSPRSDREFTVYRYRSCAICADTPVPDAGGVCPTCNKKEFPEPEKVDKDPGPQQEKLICKLAPNFWTSSAPRFYYGPV